MSVDVWWTTEGECECGVSHPIGYQPRCVHELVCDFGVFENSAADPAYGLQPLMLARKKYIAKLMVAGPQIGRRGEVVSVTVSDQETHRRIFTHVYWKGHRTTWELFDAYLVGEDDISDFMVGRWPD